MKRATTMVSGNGNRVLVIGLDGGTFRVIKPLVTAGRLPTFARFMEEGVWGDLESTIPPITPPGWTSFMTGKNPGKHGVYGFYYRRNGSYETSLANALSIKARRFWEHFDERHRVGLVAIPMTYPPQPVNGYMISGIYVPSEQSIFTFPPELHTELIRELGDYPLEQSIMEIPQSGNQIEALQRLYRHTDSRKNAALYLMQKASWDFFAIVFQGTDLIQHRAACFWDEEYCRRHPEEVQKFGQVVNQYYEKIDRCIAELVEAAGQDCSVIIVSDHGAGPSRKTLFINRWLIQQGFLALKPLRPWQAYSLEMKTSNFGAALTKAHLSPFRRMMPRWLLGKRVAVPFPIKKPLGLAAVDWNRTKAYSILRWTDGAIRINLKGREPGGVVEPGLEYETVRDVIAQRLLEIKDPETGDQVIDKVCKREEVYTGPYTDEAPDLTILTKDVSYPFGVDLEAGGLLETPADWTSGTHRMNGIFLMRGGAVNIGQELSGLRIIDVAPTVLYLMGLPIPEDMDGRVILEGIDEGYQRAHPVVHKPVPSEDLAASPEIFSTEERERIEENLKALGYIE
jgi:predicted AlkP superfamily phosphohydrolase/phosphomutase